MGRVAKYLGLAAVALAGQLVWGCTAGEETSGPRSAALKGQEAAVLYRAVGGDLVESDTARSRLVELTRLLALALGDPGARQLLRQAMEQSPIREGKLNFQLFTEGPGGRILADMARHAGMSRDGLIALRDGTVDLELYLPVAAHRGRWRGERDLIVATSLREEDTPVGFTTDGVMVPLSLEAPPDTPVLVLVPAETAPRSGPSGAMCVPTEADACGGSTGGGGNTGGSGTTPGIYMSYSYIQDLHEPWSRGDPEIEVYLLGPANANASSYRTYGGVAGEYNSYPRYFNQDNHTWTAPAGGRGVLVARKYDIEYLQSLYPPGTPAADKAFALVVYEDDQTANVIVEKHPNYSQAVFGTTLLIPFIQLRLEGSAPSQIQIAAAAAQAGMLLLINEVSNLLTLDDDLVGIVVDAQQWSGYSGVYIPRTHVLMNGAWKAGEINLQFWDY